MVPCGDCRTQLNDPKEGFHFASLSSLRQWFAPSFGHAVLGGSDDRETTCFFFFPYICSYCDCVIVSDYTDKLVGSSSRPPTMDITGGRKSVGKTQMAVAYVTALVSAAFP
tara:strand:- start:397 stop:729 length:333 start_codon:yes stop_codon:yes gene_type:complete